MKKGIKGLGLFIEHFSLFSKEEEFLLPPNTKLKLVAKNNKFKYYHTNEDFEKRIDTKYELYGIINHIGNLNGGHYYSFIRNTEEDGKFTDNWQCCNDERVSAISQEEALSSSNAYILFYTLVN